MKTINAFPAVCVASTLCCPLAHGDETRTCLPDMVAVMRPININGVDEDEVDRIWDAARRGAANSQDPGRWWMLRKSSSVLAPPWTGDEECRDTACIYQAVRDMPADLALVIILYRENGKTVMQFGEHAPPIPQPLENVVVGPAPPERLEWAAENLAQQVTARFQPRCAVRYGSKALRRANRQEMAPGPRGANRCGSSSSEGGATMIACTHDTKDDPPTGPLTCADAEKREFCRAVNMVWPGYVQFKTGDPKLASACEAAREGLRWGASPMHGPLTEKDGRCQGLWMEDFSEAAMQAEYLAPLLLSSGKNVRVVFRESGGKGTPQQAEAVSKRMRSVLERRGFVPLAGDSRGQAEHELAVEARWTKGTNAVGMAAYGLELHASFRSIEDPASTGTAVRVHPRALVPFAPDEPVGALLVLKGVGELTDEALVKAVLSPSAQP